MEQVQLPLCRRCLAALAEWEELSRQCRAEWRAAEPHVRREMAPIAAHGAWHMGEWTEMESYVRTMNSGHEPDTSSGAFLTAVLAVRSTNYDRAKGTLHKRPNHNVAALYHDV